MLETNLNDHLIIETNAHCIKNLLSSCENEIFYDVVYRRFKTMQKENRYKPKLRFILMDITEKYEKTYI